jgi:hypothetical protein
MNREPSSKQEEMESWRDVFQVSLSSVQCCHCGVLKREISFGFCLLLFIGLLEWIQLPNSEPKENGLFLSF